MDCTKCSFAQHAFCAAQMMFDQSRVIGEMREAIDALAESIKKIEEKTDSELSLPLTDISQEGSGEENRLPKQLKD